MNTTPLRGVILVAVAVLIGFLILRGVTDRQEVPLVTGAAEAVPTVGAVDDTGQAEVDPADVVEADTGAVAVPTADMTLDLSTARQPALVSVLVANGTSVPGQAGRLTDILRNQGFNMRQPKNADDQPNSVIYFRPGFEVEASVVKLALETDTRTGPMPVPDPPIGEDIDLGPVDVLVLIGNDGLSTS